MSNKRKCKRCLKRFEEKDMHGRYCRECEKKIHRKGNKNDKQTTQTI